MVSLLDTSISLLDTSISLLNTNVSKLDTSISLLDTNVSKLDTSISLLDTSISLLNTKLNTDVSLLDTSISLLNTNVSKLDTSISLLDTSISNMSNILSMLIDSSTLVNKIGVPGGFGFGVGVCPSASLPSDMTPLFGYFDPMHENYGNYVWKDGSIMVWIPKFYYRIGDPNNPTYAAYGSNSIDICGAHTFKTRSIAESNGYALHRAFIDGGEEKDGFFIDKYKCSRNQFGTG